MVASFSPRTRHSRKIRYAVLKLLNLYRVSPCQSLSYAVRPVILKLQLFVFSNKGNSQYSKLLKGTISRAGFIYFNQRLTTTIIVEECAKSFQQLLTTLEAKYFNQWRSDIIHENERNTKKFFTHIKYSLCALSECVI
jgi:hypothetical protein